MNKLLTLLKVFMNLFQITTFAATSTKNWTVIAANCEREVKFATL